MQTDKLTTKCHICLHTWKQGGLICGIWDWQSTIVKDLNDSQDPIHALFCGENAFVAIYAFFPNNAQSGHCLGFFLRFFLYEGFPYSQIRCQIHIELVKVSKDTDGKEEGKDSWRRRWRKGQGWEKEEIGKQWDCQQKEQNLSHFWLLSVHHCVQNKSCSCCFNIYNIYIYIYIHIFEKHSHQFS